MRPLNRKVKLDADASICHGHGMTTLNPTTTAAWTELIRTSRRVLDAVELALKQAGHPALDWYDALYEIEKAGPDGLRPFALKDRLLLPQYSTSRLLDRLVKAGLVERVDCDDDGRGHVVRLTEIGHSLRQAMWPVYAKVLQQQIGDTITANEADQLTRLLGKLGRDSK